LATEVEVFTTGELFSKGGWIMYTKRYTVLIGTVLLGILALTTSWSVLADDIIGPGSGYEKSIQWEPGWALDGTWIVVAPTPLGNMVFRNTYIALDPQKTKFTGDVEQINWPPVLIDLYPDMERIKIASAPVVRTGLNSYEGSMTEYFTKTGGPVAEEIVGIGVIHGTLKLVGPDLLEGQGTGAYYLAAQDADCDGFPDEGQEPVLCVPWVYSARRLRTGPGCVPTPLPEQPGE
jgi:hypothetical protein